MRSPFGSQIKLTAPILKRLVDFDQIKGPELTACYYGQNIFQGNDLNAGAMIGIPALALALKAGIFPGVITGRLSDIVYAAVSYLALDLQNWQLEGSAENIEKARVSTQEGPEHARRRYVQELLGIQERRSHRFLSVGSDHVVATFDDMGERYERPAEPLATVIDAFALAEKLRAAGPGALFMLKTGGA